MSEEPSPTAVKANVSVAWVVCGILFIVFWIIAHLVWGGMSLIADLMANDSGAASNSKHMTLIFGMIGGQVLCGAAGIPAGLAFFKPSRRKFLLRLFAILFVVGALIQGGVFSYLLLLHAMNKSLLFASLLLGTGLRAAEPQTLFFAEENSKEYTRISLTIEGDKVTGTQNWLPKAPDGHGAHGVINGTLAEGGIMKVLYEYTIEGSEQSEEEVLKLYGGKLFIGEGQLLADPKNDAHLKLQDASKVVFKKSLAGVPAHEPKAGTPERKAIMDAMRVPVSAEVGQEVAFTGTVRVSGAWARFSGHVDPANGKAKNDKVTEDLELDFFALMQKDGQGAWKVLIKGFAGDISLVEEAKEKFPKAPWVLYE